jgi:hypothetical protein
MLVVILNGRVSCAGRPIYAATGNAGPRTHTSTEECECFHFFHFLSFDCDILAILIFDCASSDTIVQYDLMSFAEKSSVSRFWSHKNIELQDFHEILEFIFIKFRNFP